MIHYSRNKLKNREENLKRTFTWMKKYYRQVSALITYN